MQARISAPAACCRLHSRGLVAPASLLRSRLSTGSHRCRISLFSTLPGSRHVLVPHAQRRPTGGNAENMARTPAQGLKEKVEAVVDESEDDEDEEQQEIAEDEAGEYEQQEDEEQEDEQQEDEQQEDEEQAGEEQEDEQGDDDQQEDEQQEDEQTDQQEDDNEQEDEQQEDEQEDEQEDDNEHENEQEDEDEQEDEQQEGEREDEEQEDEDQEDEEDESAEAEEGDNEPTALISNNDESAPRRFKYHRDLFRAAQQGDYDAAEEVIADMIDDQLPPGPRAAHVLLYAYAKAGAAAEGLVRARECIESGIQLLPETYCALIHAQAHAREIANCYALVEAMEARTGSAEAGWHMFCAELLKMGQLEDALQAVDYGRQAGYSSDSALDELLITALCDKGNEAGARAELEYMRAHSTDITSAYINPLVRLVASTGRTTDAMDLIKDQNKRGNPETSSFNALLEGTVVSIKEGTADLDKLASFLPGLKASMQQLYVPRDLRTIELVLACCALVGTGRRRWSIKLALEMWDALADTPESADHLDQDTLGALTGMLATSNRPADLMRVLKHVEQNPQFSLPPKALAPMEDGATLITAWFGPSRYQRQEAGASGLDDDAEPEIRQVEGGFKFGVGDCLVDDDGVIVKLKDMKLDDMRAELSFRGLDATGTKTVLSARLTEERARLSYRVWEANERRKKDVEESVGDPGEALGDLPDGLGEEEEPAEEEMKDEDLFVMAGEMLAMGDDEVDAKQMVKKKRGRPSKEYRVQPVRWRNYKPVVLEPEERAALEDSIANLMGGVKVDVDALEEAGQDPTKVYKATLDKILRNTQKEDVKSLISIDPMVTGDISMEEARQLDPDLDVDIQEEQEETDEVNDAEPSEDEELSDGDFLTQRALNATSLTEESGQADEATNASAGVEEALAVLQLVEALGGQASMVDLARLIRASEVTGKPQHCWELAQRIHLAASPRSFDEARELYSRATMTCLRAQDLAKAQNCADLAAARGFGITEEAAEQLRAAGGTLQPVQPVQYAEPAEREAETARKMADRRSQQAQEDEMEFDASSIMQGDQYKDEDGEMEVEYEEEEEEAAEGPQASERKDTNTAQPVAPNRSQGNPYEDEDGEMEVEEEEYEEEEEAAEAPEEEEEEDTDTAQPAAPNRSRGRRRA